MRQVGYCDRAGDYCDCHASTGLGDSYLSVAGGDYFRPPPSDRKLKIVWVEVGMLEDLALLLRIPLDMRMPGQRSVASMGFSCLEALADMVPKVKFSRQVCQREQRCLSSTSAWAHASCGDRVEKCVGHEECTLHRNGTELLGSCRYIHARRFHDSHGWHHAPAFTHDLSDS